MTYVDSVAKYKASSCPAKGFAMFSGVMAPQLSTTQALQM